MKKIFRMLFCLIGMLLGYGIFNLFRDVIRNHYIGINSITVYGLMSLFIILPGIIFYLLYPGIVRWIKELMKYIEKILKKIPVTDLIYGSVGLVLGLIVASLIGMPFSRMPYVGYIIQIVLDIVLSYIGMEVIIKNKDELTNFLLSAKRNKKENVADDGNGIKPKILDTSVIIDGRIFDICKTGFIEGPIIIPSFVLEELRHIADSSDALKRNRGRRGLDILNRMQKELDIRVDIFEKNYDDSIEVDNKLLKLAQFMDGKVITNDFNLNKVAEFQGVSVLNINELSNAVKPVVLPGEEMEVIVIKEGKENGQGIAYLDDGTMIVIDGGKKRIGENIEVLVTSVLQTAAGRMIFARVKGNTQEKVI